MRPEAGGRSVTVLVADDNDDVRLVITRLLDRPDSGFRVVGQSTGGQQTVDLCERLRPDIVVIDRRMPAMDGFACIRALRELDSDQKVLLISAAIGPEVRSAAAELDVPWLDKSELRALPARLAELAEGSPVERSRARRQGSDLAVVPEDDDPVRVHDGRDEQRGG